MKKSLLGILIPVFMAAGLVASPGLAQDKAKAEKGKPVMKVLAENDKVRAWEITYKPGDENTAVPSSTTRVVRALKGGTLMRTYTDGKTEKVEWKAGEARINAPSGQYTAKNVGKTDIVLYVVLVKEPKK
jgi:hypothetical protein